MDQITHLIKRILLGLIVNIDKDVFALSDEVRSTSSLISTDRGFAK